MAARSVIGAAVDLLTLRVEAAPSGVRGVGVSVAEFPDGWVLSTSASALHAVLALCPADVHVCSWHRQIRRTRSRRPLSAWEPLIVHGGRELATNVMQTATDALAYVGRYHSFPGAITGMKPPQFSAWMFAQLGALPATSSTISFPAPGPSAKHGDATRA